MAQFLAAIKGARGEATRLGSKSSGIRAQAQGWNSGVVVFGRTENGKDVFEIFLTGGSSDPSQKLFVGELKGNCFHLSSELRGIHVKTI